MTYSETELKLFASFNYTELAHHLMPMPLYRVLVEYAFVRNLAGPNVEALRRGAKALLLDAKPYRMTPEFDALITILSNTKVINMERGKCLLCLVQLEPVDDDLNGERNCICVRCSAEEKHDFDVEPNVKI